ncbi:hypothetical protein [Anaerostipes caccae]|uniref:hypothetical protein n=1 Tax=Anaerostipes caccae TaxID=105841 RepID=UPI0038D4F6F7
MNLRRAEGPGKGIGRQMDTNSLRSATGSLSKARKRTEKEIDDITGARKHCRRHKHGEVIYRGI